MTDCKAALLLRSHSGSRGRIRGLKPYICEVRIVPAEAGTYRNQLSDRF